MSTGATLFVLALMIFCAVKGLTWNARWNADPDIKWTANWFKLVLIGLLGWIALGAMLAMQSIFNKVSLTCLAIAAALCALSVWRAGTVNLPTIGAKLKFGYRLFLVGTGKWARFVMMGSLIGIPAVRIAERMAVEGDMFWDNMVRQYERQAKEKANSTSEPLFDFSDTVQPESTSTPEKKVEVWRENGMMTENLKVSSDGERYYDPDDGEWHRIKN